MTRKRILAIAYTCMPDVGSEPEAGWAWARIAAGIGDTWVLTRPWPDRRRQLEDALATAPEQASMHITYVDLPRWLGSRDWDPFLKGHQRIEYVLWQFAALRTARRIASRERIDLVWHLTFANVWMGSVGALIGPPFVLGPVGGGVGTPWKLLQGFGWRGILAEVLRTLVRTAARYTNILARVAWSRASLILVQNRETYRWLPASTRNRTEIFHNSVVQDVGSDPLRSRPADTHKVALFAGRLVAWKGARLAVEALALLPDWRLIVLGSGPDEPGLRALAKRLNVADRVEFRGWVPHAEVLRAMRDDVDLMVLPSMHDEGSFAVAEALAAGLPVVCLDRGGPPVVGGSAVRAGSKRGTVRRLALAISRMDRASEPRPPTPTIEERRDRIVEILQRRGMIDPPSDDARRT